MALIHKLDKQTINAIAAGEVIERPASVAKELIDNALDAGASIIRLALENGGIKQLSCLDNGRGMSREDARLSIESHATSKLTKTEDLFNIDTMGFRGEALPSIASVSQLEVRTRRLEDEEGTRLLVEGGELIEEGPYGMAPGSQIICRQLFYNMPARYKFLKSDAAETGAVADITGKIALARPDVSFRLERLNDGKELLYTPGDNDLLSAIYVIYGQEAAGQMMPVALEEGPVRISGYMTGPQAARHNRARQVFLINGRVIQSPVLRAAVDEACKTWFMKGRFSQLVLNLKIPGNLLDVNVHPQKIQVRFWDDRAVFRSVYQAVRAALEGGGRIIQVDKVPEEKPQEASIQLAFSSQEKIQTPSQIHYDRPAPEPVQMEEASSPAIPAQDQSPRTDPIPHVVSKARDLDLEKLLEARLIGTLLDTYILLDDGQSLILIDQHAAHERVLYEELLKKREEKGQTPVRGQTLLLPVRLEVSQAEMALLEEEASYFQQLGFDFEPFGGGSIALRTVPMTRADGRPALEPATAFRATLDALAAARQTGSALDDSEVLHLMACKAAVKAQDRLSDHEITILIKRLVQLTNPFHCPHGRPVALRLSREDIEKRFGRIV